MNIKATIKVNKLDKSAFFKGAKGTYVDITLWENDQPDEYGNTHSAKQDMGKDRRGEKTPYVGNMKPFGDGGNPRGGRDVAAKDATYRGNKSAPQKPADDDGDFDDVPF